MSEADVVDFIDGKICWECADTNPVFAHDVCQKLYDVVLFLSDEWSVM